MVVAVAAADAAAANAGKASSSAGGGGGGRPLLRMTMLRVNKWRSRSREVRDLPCCLVFVDVHHLFSPSRIRGGCGWGGRAASEAMEEENPAWPCTDTTPGASPKGGRVGGRERVVVVMSVLVEFELS